MGELEYRTGWKWRPGLISHTSQRAQANPRAPNSTNKVLFEDILPQSRYNIYDGHSIVGQGRLLGGSCHLDCL